MVCVEKKSVLFSTAHANVLWPTDNGQFGHEPIFLHNRYVKKYPNWKGGKVSGFYKKFTSWLWKNSCGKEVYSFYFKTLDFPSRVTYKGDFSKSGPSIKTQSGLKTEAEIVAYTTFFGVYKLKFYMVAIMKLDDMLDDMSVSSRLHFYKLISWSFLSSYPGVVSLPLPLLAFASINYHY